MNELKMAAEHFTALLEKQMQRVAQMQEEQVDFTDGRTVTIGLVDGDGIGPVIMEQAVAYGIGLASHEEIDEINILQATFLAMQRALDQLTVKPDLALIDGNRQKDFGVPVKTVVKGDSLSMSIAAASILAKVTRDRMCEDMDKAYPQYGIAKHKGYGTKEHMEALREHGPSPIHRTKFIRFLNEENHE